MIYYRSPAQIVPDSEAVREGDEVLIIDTNGSQEWEHGYQWRYRQGVVRWVNDTQINLDQTSSREFTASSTMYGKSQVHNPEWYCTRILTITPKMYVILLDRKTLSSEDLTKYARQSIK